MRRTLLPMAIVAVLALVAWATAGLVSSWSQDPAPQSTEAASRHAEYPPAVARNEHAGTANGDAPASDADDGAVRAQAERGPSMGAVSSSDPGGGSAARSGVTSGSGESREETPGQDEAIALPEKTELQYPGLGSRLNALVACAEDAESSAEGTNGESPARSGEPLAVTIHLSGNVDEVVGFLEGNGGDPRNVGEDYIEAYVPVTLLGPVSEQPGVIRVREIVPAAPDGTGAGRSPACHGYGTVGGLAPSR